MRVPRPSVIVPSVITLSVISVGLLIGGTSAAAHHSFAAEFDAGQPVTIEGVVTKVEWTNPHVWFFVNVANPDTGEVVNWGAEMGSPNALGRNGWMPGTMHVGMRVTVSGSRAKDGSRRLNTRTVTVDGRRLGAASSQQSAP
jgi:hypothetical protein